MILLSREDIRRVFTMRDAIEADKEAFRLHSAGKSQTPLRTNIQASRHNGTLLFMPAYVEDIDCACLKIVNIFPDNVKIGLPTAPSQVLLIDGVSGIVSAVLDGTYVTQLRTGAATGAAFDILARRDSKVGCLIGTGGQAPTQLEAMLVARDLDVVKIYDLDAERLECFVAQMREELSTYRTRIVAAASAAVAVADADLLVTMTASCTPVFDASKVKEGCTVSCVGSYQPHMQEMDPAILTRAGKIYFDSRSAVLAESGDLMIPLRDGALTEEAFTGELGELLLGRIPGRESESELIVFKTVGIGTQDLLAAKTIYDKAVTAGIGTRWN